MNRQNPFSGETLRMNDRDWDRLLDLLDDRLVVPVTGPELLIPDTSTDRGYYDIWGRALAETAGIGLADAAGNTSVFSVANRLSTRSTPNDLTYDIDAVIRRRPWTTPPALKQLAEISSIDLYITTTIDHLLGNALKEQDQGRRGLEDIIFSPNGSKSRTDLPTDFAYSRVPGLFHLFGATSSVDGTFAKTEDDLIEFSWSLLDQQYAPTRLYDYLQSKTILMLGCNFPDWLGRFFIRALYGGRTNDKLNIYYVSNNCEAGLRDFLGRRKAKVCSQLSPIEFVERLSRRWKERQVSASTDSGMTTVAKSENRLKSGAVFLSYAREDREVVRGIREQLERANIDTWWDEDLQVAQHFPETIRENISNASFFIAVISQNLSRDDPQGRFLWKEWKWAEEANMARRREDRFLQPLVIDDTPDGAAFVEPPYRDLHWARLINGRLPEKMIDFLSGGIRRFRKAATNFPVAGSPV